MRKPRLLLCFDAFGTLFRPKKPVSTQYADIARGCGLSGFSDDDVARSFKDAFKEETRLNPNYGRATGLGATNWWTNVIHRTFTPLVSPGLSLPPSLAPALLHRFASSEAYTCEPDLVRSIRALKSRGSSSPFSDVAIGVLTNSDDRVPGILSSFGLRVSPLRYGTESGSSIPNGGHDIDFHCMSYDVGVEKPDERIFDAAEDMLARITPGQVAAKAGPVESQGLLYKLYVGDEWEKDVIGASKAGWSAIFLEPEGTDARTRRIDELAKDEEIITLLESKAPLSASSIRSVCRWLSA